MTTALSAAVIGLGQIGFGFDLDPGRRQIWTHSGAYAARPELFTLAAAVEPREDIRAAFSARFPATRTFPDIASMMIAVRPDVVSVCTPIDHHPAALATVQEHGGAKAIWCEKPLSGDIVSAQEMVAMCERHDIPMVVSYVRAWLPLWRRAKALAAPDTIGTLRCIRVAMPNRLLSVGSHALSLLYWLGGDIESVSPLALAALEEAGEHASAALVSFASGAYGILQVTGMKRQLIVEAEIIGDEGRVTVREDTGEIRLERFREGASYSGYRTLHTQSVEVAAGFQEASPFVAIAEELYNVAHRQTVPTCGARNALMVQVLAETMRGATSSLPVV